MSLEKEVEETGAIMRRIFGRGDLIKVGDSQIKLYQRNFWRFWKKHLVCSCIPKFGRAEFYVGVDSAKEKFEACYKQKFGRALEVSTYLFKKIYL